MSTLKAKKIDFIKQYSITAIAIFVCQFAWVFSSKAQSSAPQNQYSFGYQQTIGSIVKHSSSFMPEVKGLTAFCEIKYANSFLKHKTWKQYHQFPELNISLLYARYGNRPIFGDSYNALIGLNYTKKNSKWKRNFAYQFGVNYSTRPYNINTNPTNNIIGSTINFALKLSYGFEYFINPNLSAGLNAVLMHHSNGSAETPNLGINVAGVGLNLKWYQTKSQNAKVQNENTNVVLTKAHQFGIAIAYARYERIKPFNGPKYAVYGLQIFGQKRVSALWQINYGFNFNYRTAVAQGFQNYDIFSRANFFKSVRWYPYVGAELLYGNFGLAASVGFYPVSKNAISTRIPTTFGVNYYVKNLDTQPKNNIRLSINLKSHFAVAEYIAFLAGYVF